MSPRAQLTKSDHEAWRERMRAVTEEMRKRREGRSDVWGVAEGQFRNGTFLPHGENKR